MPDEILPLNLESIQEASRALVGTHDFSSFQGSPTDSDSPVCTVTRLTIERFGDEIRFEVEANRFLKQMVRNIVGTLLEVARGKLKAGEVAVGVTEQAIQVLGGYGYIKDFPVEKWYRDAKIYTLFEGTSEIQRIVISRALAKS